MFFLITQKLFLDDENSPKSEFTLNKLSLNTRIDEFLMKMKGSSENGNLRTFSPNYRLDQHTKKNTISVFGGNFQGQKLELFLRILILNLEMVPNVHPKK